jgi:hypothetical protein
MTVRNVKWLIALVVVIVVTISAKAGDLEIKSVGGNG